MLMKQICSAERVDRVKQGTGSIHNSVIGIQMCVNKTDAHRFVTMLMYMLKRFAPSMRPRLC